MHVALLLGLLLISLLLPAVPQAALYHEFADTRTLLGVPHFWNAISNLPFVLAGLAGLAVLLPERASALFREPRERWPYAAFFACVLLSGLGSTWYHLDPGDARLFWDRLPIALSSGALVVAVPGDHSERPRSALELAAMLLVCAATAIYWNASGNLTPYLVLSVYVVVALLVILWLGTPHYDRRGDFGVVLALYALARLGEWQDGAVFAAGELLSGHTLKHLLAALACFWVVRMIRRRHRIAGPQASGLPATP